MIFDGNVPDYLQQNRVQRCEVTAH